MSRHRINVASNLIIVAAATVFLVSIFLDSPLVVTGPHGSHALKLIEQTANIDELKMVCGTMALQLEAVSQGQRPLTLSIILFALTVIAVSSLNLFIHVRSKQE